MVNIIRRLSGKPQGLTCHPSFCWHCAICSTEPTRLDEKHRWVFVSRKLRWLLYLGQATTYISLFKFSAPTSHWEHCSTPGKTPWDSSPEIQTPQEHLNFLQTVAETNRPSQRLVQLDKCSSSFGFCLCRICLWYFCG